MPSPRKRIGFLPGVEIQQIIDKICEQEGLSQSKVTGILVEEALKRRGLYDPKLDKKEFINTLTEVIFSEKYNNDSGKIENKKKSDIISDINYAIDDQDNEISYTKKDFNLLKDYIEFKRFKNMMRRVNEEQIG